MTFKPYCASCGTWHTEEEGHVQHDAHKQMWLDHWCAQLDRKIRHYQRQDAQRRIDDETKDAADEASGIAR